MHIKGPHCVLSFALRSPAWAETSAERAALEGICISTFMFQTCPCQKAQFGMPFYIITLIFKASFLLLSAAHKLMLKSLQWNRSSVNSNHRPLVLQSAGSPFLSCSKKKGENFSGRGWINPQTWECNHIWLEVWTTQAGWCFFSSTLQSQCYIWDFICMQRTQRLASAYTSRKWTFRQSLQRKRTAQSKQIARLAQTNAV